MRKFYIVKNICSGGDLLHKVKETKLSEEEIGFIMFQILSSLAHLHEQGIIHRDLKLEDIIFSSQGKDTRVQLVDFGFSSFYTPGENLTLKVGTVREKNLKKIID